MLRLTDEIHEQWARVEGVVAVDVVGPVTVAVRMNGNDTVVVIRPVDRSAPHVR